MSYKIIQQLLDTQLRTTVDLPTLYTENALSNEKLGGTWCRSTLLPSKPEIVSIGTGGKTRYIGLYQVDLFYPKDRGFLNSNTMADTVLAKFTKGTRLTSNSTTVLVEIAWKQPAGVVGVFYNTPVIVEWSAYL